MSLRLLTEPKGVPDSSPSLAAPTVTCRPTPPSQTRVPLSLGPSSSHCSPSCNPCPASLSGLVHSKSAFQTAHGACPWGDPHSSSTSTCPFPRCGSSSSLRNIVHQGLFVSITFLQCRGKELLIFSSLFLLLPRTKSLLHPSMSYLDAEASRYSGRCKETFQRDTLLQS